ncbi:MAG: nicotinate (nicotinamide) nucleotide adenylyltransferase [Chloroflexi bacterium]|nr:nicotinate (nicotinamide) nucleotide adenylyltransferase [Chloroflexota bacterium]
MAGIRLGVLGGTFDPVHIGHLALAEQAREQLALERVLWVPSGDPWRKADRTVTAAKHRAAMVRLAIEGHASYKLCLLEIERSGPSYSVETLAELQRIEPGSELFFVLGLDALEDLPNWREPARLIELATLAVAARGARQPAAEELDRLVPGLGGRVVWLEMPHIDVSATELRRLAAEGADLRDRTPASVEAYIREHRLYSRD